ncbi:MAG: hypothetical protein PUP46_01005, partial [Endozoicomonas sp. (ex Botrylloides leachii)]|nr:hypothetical protein [Endozoicomonas sp. (ex Botrylloides leachii)]
IPLKDELKKQLLDKMNDVSNYGFSTVDVKATHSFLEEEKLLLYIVKSEGRNLLDDLSTDDTHIYTKDDQLQTKIDFEYSGLNLSGALHSLTWSYLGRTGRSIYNYFTSSDSN